jgi:hypothetical protein
MGEHNRFDSVDGRAKRFGTCQVTNDKVHLVGQDARSPGLVTHQGPDGVPLAERFGYGVAADASGGADDQHG